MVLKINNPQFKQGYLYAVRLLTASKKSASELLKRLAEKGYTEESAGQVIEELKKHGLLNDQKLIHETIQWAAHTKKYGKRRIALQLRKKGISANAIDQALEDYPKDIEQEAALGLARERWEKLKTVEPKKRKKRLYDFLINRGFDFELSREVTLQMEKL